MRNPFRPAPPQRPSPQQHVYRSPAPIPAYRSPVHGVAPTRRPVPSLQEMERELAAAESNELDALTAAHRESLNGLRRQQAVEMELTPQNERDELRDKQNREELSLRDTHATELADTQSTHRQRRDDAHAVASGHGVAAPGAPLRTGGQARNLPVEYRIPCERCRAGVGQRCRTEGGEVAYLAHKVRRDAANVRYRRAPTRG